jgi:chitin disaccharide deacetylase
MTNPPVYKVMARDPVTDGQGSTGRAGVIINADDWGRDKEVTDHSLDCVLQGVVSSVSAMVFMEDSERAAALAQHNNVDAGLHLNLTTAFTSSGCKSGLRNQQQRLMRFLRGSHLSPAIYHPGLASSFEYVVKAQLEEYERLYGMPAGRVDGHHHMHLCANIQFQQLLPAGTIARRNFSFSAREKGAINRIYRRWQDRRLARRHRLTDFFFALLPMDPPCRLEEIFALANRSSVEVETHPVNPEEYRFLIGGELLRRAGATRIARGYRLA